MTKLKRDLPRTSRLKTLHDHNENSTILQASDINQFKHSRSAQVPCVCALTVGIRLIPRRAVPVRFEPLSRRLLWHAFPSRCWRFQRGLSARFDADLRGGV